MVRTSHKTALKRTAFTLIELIFAIVIISISMLALPMVMQIDASNQEDALFQEGILLASTKASQALTFPWDAQSTPGGGALLSLSNVLNTGSVAGGMGRIGVTDFRVGHFRESLRRRLSPNALPRGASPIAAGDNSIANQHNIPDIIGLGDATSYKKNWSVVTFVSYVNDNTNYALTDIVFGFTTAAAAGGTTNIKLVTVTATDNSVGAGGNQVVLRSYASNIGENEFFKRRY